MCNMCGTYIKHMFEHISTVHDTHMSSYMLAYVSPICDIYKIETFHIWVIYVPHTWHTYVAMYAGIYACIYVPYMTHICGRICWHMCLHMCLLYDSYISPYISHIWNVSISYMSHIIFYMTTYMQTYALLIYFGIYVFTVYICQHIYYFLYVAYMYVPYGIIIGLHSAGYIEDKTIKRSTLRLMRSKVNVTRRQSSI